MRLAATSAAVAGACLALVAASSGRPNADIRWRRLVGLPGAVDVAGPRADRRLVVAGRDGLFLMRRSGALTPFARGPYGYVPPRGEAYLALTLKHRVPGANCSFRRDDVYAVDPVDHPGVNLIERSGRARRFADLPAGSFLSSIAFDAVGRFGHRLLVTALVADRTTLYAIDCRGRVRVVGRGLARVEGGAAVAPARFGRFGGQLIGVNELTGTVYAFNARGRVRLLAHPNVAFGADIGVESVGFVPRGFTRRGAAYLADLGAPGSPTRGTDSVLSLPGPALLRAGARPGDLLVATEAGGVTLAIRCGRRCGTRQIGRALDATHAEGHFGFAVR
jgi:hypothetical protein